MYIFKNFIFLLLLMRCSAVFADNCLIDESQKVRTNFKTLYDQKKYIKAEEYLSSYISRCTAGQYDLIEPLSLHFWMISDLMLVQKKIGRYQFCIHRGLGAMYMWGWGDELDKEQKGNAMSAIRFNLKQCRSRLPALEGVDLTKKPCPIKKFSNAIAIPKSWKFSEEQGVCIDMNTGTYLTEDEFQQFMGDSKILAPYLVLIKRGDSGGYIEQKIPLVNGRLGEGDGCGRLKISLGGDFKRKLVNLSGTLGFCWPGTGLWAVDDVYRIDGNNALMVNEISESLH